MALETSSDTMQRFNMDAILTNLGFTADIRSRFSEERIDVTTVLAASDQELIRLGVKTIGERIHLREACKMPAAAQEPQVTATATGTGAMRMDEQVRQERNLLFRPRLSSSAHSSRKRAQQKAKDSTARKTAKGRANNRSRSWTASFFCLADKRASKVPTPSERQTLHNAGLGFKKIKLYSDDDEKSVLEKITSSSLDEDGDVIGFPQLQGAGGFEMLQCRANCKDLDVIDCAWNVSDIRAVVGSGQAKIFLRPIQKSLSTAPKVVKETRSSLTEVCIVCKHVIPIHELRSHLEECKEYSSSSSDSDDEVALPPFMQRQRLCDLEIPAHTIAENNIETTDDNNRESSAAISEEQYQIVDLTQQHQDAKRENHSEQLTELLCPDKELEEQIEGIVQQCKESNTGFNPVEILRCLQNHLIHGRPLHITDTESSPEGDTAFIMVDRQNLITTAFDEIKGITDKFLTLEVQFYNEVHIQILLCIIFRYNTDLVPACYTTG